MHPTIGYFQVSENVYVDDLTGEETIEMSPVADGAVPFPVRPSGEQWRINDEKIGWIEVTADELRARMPSLSRLQFRTAFKNAGMTTVVINAAIAAVADPNAQEDYQIAWEDAQSFKRIDPLVQLIAAHAGKTAAEIDAVWTQGFTI